MSVQLKQNDDLSLGLQGTDLDQGSFVVEGVAYTTASPLTQTIGVFTRRMVIKAIVGVPDVASTNAVTATIYKAPSGTAIGSGTALHTGTFNLQGTANTNQTLTLSSTSGALDIPAGTRIGIVISGALGASGSGTITLHLAPA
jgi:hypothetical protein